MTAAHPQAPYFIWHAPNKAAIARYHLDTAEIDAQLAALRASGADGISLSPWLFKNAVALGMSDTFLDWENGYLTPQNSANLCQLLHKIKQLGFNWVQIAPQFYGPNDFRASWNGNFIESLYQENLTFIFGLPILFAGAGLPYLIDACAEVTDGEYARRLWTDISGWFYTGGKPTWNFTMSFLPDPASVASLASLFKGLDQAGPINPPAILAPHIYTNEPGFASLSDCLHSVQSGLKAIGLGNSDWIFGETDTLTQPQDVSVALDVEQFISDTKQRFLRVCPWPVDPRTAVNVQLDLTSCVPQRFSQPWADCGF